MAARPGEELRSRRLPGGKGYALWAFLSVLLQAMAVVVLKCAAGFRGSWSWSLFGTYGAVLCLILTRVVCWNLALARGRLSEVYAFTALAPVFLLILSVVALQERISRTSVVGVVVIAGAIYLQKKPVGKRP